ncbi:hypothetical protein Pmar_PMAR001095 [Perkinsus marinus ATCC 50983]|uniref:Uncharacterized protein n=1 Tax=Perkinsus marinus (strain ATCC 50983 / TXsc) TaxID=423536 RepID=C5KSU8_PERM5|nr:hypothetical protein Pmar_PMAR001095 [Perkinsus marinus ATCC 50983]EER12298.1 hypothetical protein Pmar_PMAR001095 [Perkinsus marinus ATCC 50983]|eukprot:XP_002780503.1 hypothetical protein Pmar_PMAR001095 [Perkinsus marinus ATCC 50983]
MGKTLRVQSPKSQAAPPKASGGAARLSTLGGSRESSTVNRNDVKKKPVKSNTISFSKHLRRSMMIRLFLQVL